MRTKTVITQVEFFKASYGTGSAKVAPRKFSSLTLRLSGEISISTTESSFVSKPNSLTFVPAGCAYKTTVLKEGEMLIMHYIIANDSCNFNEHPICIPLKYPDQFISVFKKAINHSKSDRHIYDCMADAYKLLAEAESSLFSNHVHPYKKMNEIKKYIDENLYDTSLKISHIAEKFGASEVYFRREFKKYYGHSPIEYIKNQRLELACQLLNTGLYSVTEVGMRSGFDSISYFSSEFSRKFGRSPKEYKKL